MSQVQDHFDEIAKRYDYFKKKNWYYYENLKRLLKEHIPEDKKVLEIGCGTGDLIVSLNPKKGIGQDISDKMIKIACKKYDKNKNIKFTTTEISKLRRHNFDYIFMSDVIEHLEDPLSMFNDISSLMSKDTVFIITMANPLWEPILLLAEKLKLKMPEGKHHRINYKEIEALLKENNISVITHNNTLLLPIYIPVVSQVINKFEMTFKKACFIEYVISKKN